MGESYIPPAFNKSGFHCPHCGIKAHQEWLNRVTAEQANIVHGSHYQVIKKLDVDNFCVSRCNHCGNFAFWNGTRMVYPPLSTAPLPADDMPEEIKIDYMEARDILQRSPRGAAALLRLVIQKLMPVLGEKGKNLNDDIASLVSKGLPVQVQQALDSLRVIGNESVHPGELDMKDNHETANALFEIANLIVERMITHPKKITTLYNSLPAKKLAEIKKRDEK